MEIVGIIDKYKFAEIREFIPINAIVTTEDIPILYVKCLNCKDKTLRRYSIRNDYKICKIDNGNIKYVNVFNVNNWIEIKDKYIKFSVIIDKLDHEFMLKLLCCQLFKLHHADREYYINENGNLSKYCYCLSVKRADFDSKPRYKKLLIAIELFTVLLLLKWIQESGFAI